MIPSSDAPVEAFKSLEIDVVKIYEVQGDRHTYLAKGKLEICYAPEFDRFLLRLNSFRYLLSPDVPAMATLFPQNSFRSYILPALHGYYVLKLKTIPSPSLLKNLEIILSTYSRFSYQPGQESDLEKQVKGEFKYAVINTKATNNQKSSPKNQNALESEDSIREQLNKAENVAKRKMEEETKGGDSDELNYKLLDQLRQGEYFGNQIIEFPRYEIKALFFLRKEMDKSTDPSKVELANLPQSQPETWGVWMKKTTSNILVKPFTSKWWKRSEDPPKKEERQESHPSDEDEAKLNPYHEINKKKQQDNFAPNLYGNLYGDPMETPLKESIPQKEAVKIATNILEKRIDQDKDRMMASSIGHINPYPKLNSSGP